MEKKKILYIIVFFLCLVIMIKKTEQIVSENRAVALYGDELKKCEWVWNNVKDFEEKRDILQDDYIYDGVLDYAATAKEYGDRFVYSIHDLNKDGIQELVTGVCDVQSNEKEPVIRMIFYYEDGDLKVDYQDRYLMDIYKGGIVESCYTTGVHVEYRYHRYAPKSGMKEELGSLEFLDKEPPKFYKLIYGKGERKVEITKAEYEHQKRIYAETGEEGSFKKCGITNDEPPKYYGFIEIRELEQKIEITEEEYNRQKELYIGSGKEDLQWRELKGFLEGGETFESLFQNK